MKVRARRQAIASRAVAIGLSLGMTMIMQTGHAAELDVGDVTECERQLSTAQQANRAFQEKKQLKKQECTGLFNEVTRVNGEVESAKQRYESAKRQVDAARVEHQRNFDLWQEADKNYQKLSGFTVTINGATRSCSSGFDMSRPHSPGEGDCSFDVAPGSCNISVSAPGYETVTFQNTCDKDETVMTTLPKKQ